MRHSVSKILMWLSIFELLNLCSKNCGNFAMTLFANQKLKNVTGKISRSTVKMRNMLLAKRSVLKCILREILKNYQNCFDEIWENCSDPGVKKCLALATGLANLADRTSEFKVDFLFWMFPLRESKLFISNNLFSIVGLGKLLNLWDFSYYIRTFKFPLERWIMFPSSRRRFCWKITSRWGFEPVSKFRVETIENRIKCK